MDKSLCKLTLVYPPDSEDQIVAFFLESCPPLPGFTTWMADGHGLDFREATAGERVRGRVRRGVLAAVLPRARVPSLLDGIRRELPVPRLAYWVEPVDSFGRLTPVPPAPKEPLAPEAAPEPELTLPRPGRT